MTADLRVLLVTASTRSALTNTAALRTARQVAPADLAMVPGYVDAAVIEAACVQLPAPRSAVGSDGTVVDPVFRAGLAQVLGSVAGRIGHAQAWRDAREAP